MVAHRLHVYVDGVEVPDVVPVPVTIVHGRSTADAQPDAADLTLEWLSGDNIPRFNAKIRVDMTIDTPPPAALWADPLALWADPKVTWDGQWVTTFTRFYGRVVDIDVQEDGGQPVSARITAVHHMAALGRRHITLTRPQETDVDRVTAILDAAPVFTRRITGTPGGPLAAATIDTDVLTALHDVCESTGGLLWHDQDGTLTYGTADHRNLTDPVGALPDTTIIDRIRWQLAAADLINQVAVTYGPAGSQAETVVADAESVGKYGVWDAAVSTGLADVTAAGQLGSLIVARRGWPFARIGDVLIDSRDLTTADLLGVVGLLRVSDTVLLPIPPDPGPTGELAEWVVEGWVEHWPDWNRFELQLAVTDRERFVDTTLRTWGDADGFTWQQELDRGRWLDALILQPAEATT